MDAIEEVRRRGGIVRVSVLRAAGVSEHALRRAKSSGGLMTPRQGWVALPDADAARLGAIERGVVLTCVSAAQHHGLWMPEKMPLHVGAPAHAARIQVPSHVVVHWSVPIVPRDPDEAIDSLVNALVILARCQPFETALVIWESALNRRLIDAEFLRGLHLPPRARELLEAARPFSDSGLETIFVHRLRWLGLPMLPQAWILDRRVDLLIGERLVIQIDGATHTGAQRTRDIEHDAQLTLRGYHVLRFSYEQIMDRWPEVQSVIMSAIAQGKHRA
ncbi:type IV toxin-antitoxin system AbiEi family antitoxin domain-containing protein [Microbacterium sp. H83]|uniref:type IV toxin-antitoxin system AbiEi family antitoxin domain-containing protein n=1 Tax=Microbacterium sp. H83 TaxID=1827324 RepID=UPI0008302B72|nr:type IV toxin-antitoxin system AbiEi family antitoxin domain-containing protein [Microbacterium sp. H83]